MGFLSCDLIFSVHDNCNEIPEELKLNLNFESDHAGVSFARDNLTLAFEDFSETEQHGCKYTREIRVPYNIEAHGAKTSPGISLKMENPGKGLRSLLMNAMKQILSWRNDIN